MDIRFSFSVILTVIAVAVGVCAVQGFRSRKVIGRSVGLLELTLIPPILGTLIIIASSVERRTMVGCYIYVLGMDLAMMMLVNFTNEYCRGLGNGRQKPTVMYALLGADAFQLMLNPFTGHAFSLEAVEVQHKLYYRFVPHFGQVLHRIILYAVFFCVILIFLLASVKAVRIYRERYMIILMTMVFVGIWQTFYVFSRNPIDRSMIGYGVFGLAVYYFSLRYRSLRLLDRMLSNIVSDMSESLFVYDPTGKCIWANTPGLEMTGVSIKETEKISAALKEIFGERTYVKENWNDNVVIGLGETAKYYALENHAVNDDSKHIVGSFLVIRDETEEQMKLKREVYNSTHDSMTGLYTKQHFYECIRKKLDQSPDTEYAAIFVDVKNFRIVNDVFSTAFGDLAIKQIAEWIRHDMNEKCVYGRLAGDTFGVFLPNEQFKQSKAKIEDDLVNFIVTDGEREHHLLIHLGVYESVDKNIDVSVMFDRAHLALGDIDDDYNKHIAYYDNKLRDRILWEQQMSAGLREAIETKAIRPYLQPIADREGRVVGAEALARWLHPEHGFMSPGMFIPVFERNGMITEVDRAMWRDACEILSSWTGSHDDLFISVNISPKDFYFIDVVSEIKALVEEYGISPERLRIEITETVMMNDPEEKMKILDSFRRSGFIVEMDDFGSGYSSLSLLKDMPVDVLKIDMRFLSSSGSVEKAKTIVKNIIKLAEDLEITSLTEGVETRKQYDILSDMGCRLFQGYYFAKPMPQDEFERFAFTDSAKA